MSQSNIMLWNQCTYEWYNNPNKIKFWFAKPCHIYAIPTKGLKSTTFNDNFSIKFYTYIKKTIKKNVCHQSFQFS
jgi:hypothetical protein